MWARVVCVCQSSVLWQSDQLDMDAVWDGRLDGSKDDAGSWVWGSVHEDVIWGECGVTDCHQ